MTTWPLRKLSLFALLSTLSVIGCSGAEDADLDTTQAAVRTSTTFFERRPLSGQRMERLRTTLDEADGLAWVRNQGGLVGMQWERHGGSLPSETDLAQRAFSFYAHSHDALLHKLTPVDGAHLGEALDAIGLSEIHPDADTAAARERIESTLKTAAGTRGIHVFTAKLDYQPDMYWESALVVIDVDNEQLLIATGGYGT